MDFGMEDTQNAAPGDLSTAKLASPPRRNDAPSVTKRCAPCTVRAAFPT